MTTFSSNRVSAAYAANGEGLHVYGKYRSTNYEVNPLNIQAGGFTPELDASPSDAFAQAGLNWTLDSRPVSVDGLEVPGYQALQRSDTLRTLAIHRNSYTPVQNGALMDIFCFLRDSTTITNVLQINEGRKIYITANINTEGEVLPGDIVRRQLHITNSHDGSCALKAFFTDERLWCANQLSHFMGKGFTNATADAPERGITRRHTTSITDFVKKLPQMIDLHRHSFNRQIDQFQALTQVRTTPEIARRILEATFSDRLAVPVRDKDSADPKAKRPRTLADLPEIATIHSHYSGATGIGMDLDGATGTLWGLFNSITQFHTHDAGRAKDDTARARARLEALYGGVASDRNARALGACLACV